MGVEGYNSEQMERLKDYKVPFDQEAMWATLQKKKKKRRGAFFFITMALVALAIVFLGYLMLGTQKINLKENDNKWSNIDNDVSSTTNEVARVELTDNGNVESNVSGNTENEIDRRIEGDSDNSDRDQVDSKSERTISLNDTKTISNNIPSSSNSGIEQKDRQSQSQSNSQIGGINNNRFDFVTKPLGDDLDSRNSTGSKINQVSEIESTSKVKTTDKNINISKASILDFPFLESLINKKLNLDHLKVLAAVTPSMIKPLKNYKWFVGGYAGVGYVNKSLDSTVVSETNDETLEEVSIGLDLKYQVRPNLYVSSGLEYWHVTDRRTKDQTSTVESINEEIRDVYELEETAEGFLVTTTKSVKHTIYQTLNVPLMVGLNTNNEYFNFFIEAGALYNFNVFTRGELPDYGREFSYGSTNQVSPQLGLGASYRWANGLELFSRVNWRGNQYVTNKIEERFRVEQKYSAVRAQVGVRFGF